MRTSPGAHTERGEIIDPALTPHHPSVAKISPTHFTLKCFALRGASLAARNKTVVVRSKISWSRYGSGRVLMIVVISRSSDDHYWSSGGIAFTISSASQDSVPPISKPDL
ncbi:hypothetical protein RRG08_032366 [Elysia crispata]|uniref:Uncharacterized protein n=1 Tax=Elysia crispata TaxID=231223 RepID=A0AAE1DYX1_9GAST|nr:hypothetical protein RRG08_032366 [Elysia crispata]